MAGKGKRTHVGSAPIEWYEKRHDKYGGGIDVFLFEYIKECI